MQRLALPNNGLRGTLAPASDEGYVRGIARLNGKVSFGKPWDTELAHEVGHNLDLLHAPCGGALGVDPDFEWEHGRVGIRLPRRLGGVCHGTSTGAVGIAQCVNIV